VLYHQIYHSIILVIYKNKKVFNNNNNNNSNSFTGVLTKGETRKREEAAHGCLHKIKLSSTILQHYNYYTKITDGATHFISIIAKITQLCVYVPADQNKWKVHQYNCL
jgi:hypothetical protein